MDDMLQNGTVISGTKIDKPKSFTTACNVATQIMAQVASSQLGGQSTNVYHISKFVDVSRQKFIEQEKERIKKYNLNIPKEAFDKIIEEMVAEEIKKGVQMIQYQINTLMTANGQTPFSTLFIYLNEAPEGQERDDLALVASEILRQRIKGVKNKSGAWIAPAFPKIVVAIDETNCDETKPYWNFMKLCAECTAKRMVPDYISEKIMKEYKEGNCYAPMGCRAFLSVWKDPENENKPKFWGRYNKQVCTVNLPDVALTIRDKYYKDGENLLNNEEAMKEFWKLLDERLEMAHKVLLIRINYLKGTKSDVAPILWQYGAIARLKPGETIDKTLSGGYSTASLGFVGLWETLMALTDKPHTDPENMEFAESVVRYMKERCDEWNKIPGENYGFSLYGTPEESTTYKFAKALRSRHGIVKNVTDKDYVLNSYHTNVKEHVDAFTKLSNEAHFQKWTNAGAISYIEMPNLINNQEAILSVMKYIYEHCWYAELNSKIDNCHKCGFSGEIKMIRNENNKLVWECPQCGNRDIHEMTVVRRVCGYLSNANAMNEGRMADIHDRVLHL
jgi:ribonucleoside-triphosphate reductase